MLSQRDKSKTYETLKFEIEELIINKIDYIERD
jgi:hypothetical protein